METISTSSDHTAVVTAPANAVAISQEIIDGLTNFVASDVFFPGEYLFHNGKTGQWSTGIDPSLPVETGRVLAVHVADTLSGFIQFRGKGETPIQKWWPTFLFDYDKCRATLPDNDPALWTRNKKGQLEDPMRQGILMPMTDPNTREDFVFANYSRSGVRAAKRLIAAYVKQMKAAPQTHSGCVPVIQIGSRSFDTDEGTSFAPTLTGIDWMRTSDLSIPKEPGAGEEPPCDDAFEQEPQPPVPLKKKASGKKK
jgi:hypothetical protein